MMRCPSGRHTTPFTPPVWPLIVWRGVISDVTCSSAVGENGDEGCEEDMLIARGFQLKKLWIRYLVWKLERAF